MEGALIADRYRLRRMIGKGAMREVWLGHDDFDLRVADDGRPYEHAQIPRHCRAFV
jgi:hypothetical protein